jgi:hypothetical protein
MSVPLESSPGWECDVHRALCIDMWQILQARTSGWYDDVMLLILSCESSRAFRNRIKLHTYYLLCNPPETNCIHMYVCMYIHRCRTVAHVRLTDVPVLCLSILNFKLSSSPPPRDDGCPRMAGGNIQPNPLPPNNTIGRYQDGLLHLCNRRERKAQTSDAGLHSEDPPLSTRSPPRSLPHAYERKKGRQAFYSTERNARRQRGHGTRIMVLVRTDDCSLWGFPSSLLALLEHCTAFMAR